MQDLTSFQRQILDQALTSSDRPKRDVAMSFPIKIQGILPGLRTNNQIMKVPSVEDENENRIAEILKTNFGQDPRENMEELLRPKPLGSGQKIESNDAKVQDINESARSDFISKIAPKLEEARSKLRGQITKIVNKARLNAIKANHLIQKRSTEAERAELSDVHMDESYQPISIASNDNVEESEPKHSIEGGESTVNRFRKHCGQCRSFPCPRCGAFYSERTQERAQPRNYRLKQRDPTTYVPRRANQAPEYLAQPRSVSDRYGKYNGRSRQGDDVTVGSYHNRRPGYIELKDILDKNSKALYSQNRRLGDEHLVQPMDFEHATDAIRFIQELTQRNNNEQNEDYYSNGAQNFHEKRSYKIVPLAEKDDGSVFVKISPTRHPSKLTNKPKVAAKINGYDDAETKVASSLNGKNLIEEKPKANFTQFVRDGKKYEILELSEEEGANSEEDLKILKYIYAVDQNVRTQGKDCAQNGCAETVEKDKSKNTVET